MREIYKFSDLKAIILESPNDISASKKIKKQLKHNEEQISKLIKNGELKEADKLKKENKKIEKAIKQNFNDQFKPDIDLYIVNYEAFLNKDIINGLLAQKFPFIFSDEIHMIGNKDAKRSKALHQFDSKIKIGASATPITKHPRNVYSIFKFISPDLFDSSASFEKSYVEVDNFNNEIGGKNLVQLINNISPHLFIKTKYDISSQLPKLSVVQKYIDLTPAQLETQDMIYAEIKQLNEKDKELSKNKDQNKVASDREMIKGQIFGLLQAVTEIGITPLLLDMADSKTAARYRMKDKRSPKMDTMMELIDEIFESGEKVAIFSRFKSLQPILISIINSKYPDVKIAKLNGDLSSKERVVEAYDKFRDNPEYKVLLLSNAGAEGLNLSKCKYMIELEPAESYAIQTQRHGRLERADSVFDSVTVYQLIALEGQDESQLKNVEKKEGYHIGIILGSLNNK